MSNQMSQFQVTLKVLILKLLWLFLLKNLLRFNLRKRKRILLIKNLKKNKRRMNLNHPRMEKMIFPNQVKKLLHEKTVSDDPMQEDEVVPTPAPEIISSDDDDSDDVPITKGMSSSVAARSKMKKARTARNSPVKASTSTPVSYKSRQVNVPRVKTSVQQKAGQRARAACKCSKMH